MAPRPSSLAARVRERLSAPTSWLIPAAQQSLENRYGVKVLRRDDPVLLYLSETRDEREWRSMMGSEPAISSSIRALNALLFGYRWENQIPSIRRRKMPAARALKQQADQQIAAIPRFVDVLTAIANSVYQGWVPLERLWSVEAFRFNRRPTWGIVGFRDHPHEHFSFTEDRRLVWHGGISQGKAPVIFDSEAERLGWMTPAAGSLRSPYGTALLSGLWFLHYFKRDVVSWYGRGLRNATEGILHFKDSEPPAIGAALGGLEAPNEGAAHMASLVAEIEEVVSLLESKNILASRGRVDVELILNAGFNQGVQEALAYLDKWLMISIQGSLLTSDQPGDTGSRALGDVHAATKTAYALWLATYLEEAVNREILTPVLTLNNPGEIDPEDMPAFRFRIADRPSQSEVSAFVSFGGRLDALELAERWNNLPVYVPEDGQEEDPGAVLERRPTPAPVVPLPLAPRPGEQSATPDPEPPADDPPPGPDEPSREARFRTATVPAATADGERWMQGALARLSPAMGAHVRALSRAIDDAIGDGEEPPDPFA